MSKAPFDPLADFKRHMAGESETADTTVTKMSSAKPRKPAQNFLAGQQRHQFSLGLKRIRQATNVTRASWVTGTGVLESRLAVFEAKSTSNVTKEAAEKIAARIGLTLSELLALGDPDLDSDRLHNAKKKVESVVAAHGLKVLPRWR